VPPGASPTAPTVAINARAAVREQIGGVERFAREMAVRLPSLRPDRYRTIRPPAALAHRAGHVWEQLMLPARAHDCELIYSPANLAPVASRRNVIVIHDVAALRHPEAYSSAYVRYQRAMLPALARRARQLITVSEFSKREVAEVLGVAPERIAVVPGGVSERFRPDADAEWVLAHYRLVTPYVLVVGTVSERKNLGVLSQASSALAQQGVALVLAGSGRGYLKAGEVPIRRLGYVPDDQLPALYAGARALAMPSRYEGFGLPCLEAMACGTPVVAAAAGALPETVGDAALLVDPVDPGAFSEALVTAARDEPARERLIDAGLRRAAGFTWTRTAELTDATIGGLLCSEERVGHA
jgi:glycosyltransferase involved in cell wall biosynthesis